MFGHKQQTKRLEEEIIKPLEDSKSKINGESSDDSKYRIPGSGDSERKESTRQYNFQEEHLRKHKKAFGQFSSSVTQRLETLEPVKIDLDAQEEIESGTHSIDFDGCDIKIRQSGMYMIIAAPQVGRLSGSTPRWINFWIKINNVDLANSNIQRILVDCNQKDVIPLNAVTPLNSGDIVNLVMAAETTGDGIGIEKIEPDGEPMIPSMIVTMVQLD